MVNKRQRSPDFPYRTLRESIDDLARLYDAAKTSFVPVGVALGKMGISSKSSLAQRVTASLLAYGLLSDSGAGKDKQVKVSELGKQILVDTRDAEKQHAIRAAALKPSMMRKAFDTWGAGGLPNEATIKSLLELQWGFTDRAAVRFAIVIEDNFKFARLNDYIENLDGDSESTRDTDDTSRLSDSTIVFSKDPKTKYDFELSLNKDTKILFEIKSKTGKISSNDFDFLLSWLRRLDIVEEVSVETEEEAPF